MMWSRRDELMRSMIAARVVDLPLPVGPVTSTKPRGSSASSATMGGKPRSSSPRISNGMARKAPATAPRCMNTFARKRDRPFTPKEKSSSLLFSNFTFCSSVITS